MAEEEGEVVVDPALAVVQVGVAHAAGLDCDERLTGTGVGHDDRLDRHRLALGPGDHSTYFLGHGRERSRSGDLGRTAITTHTSSS